MRAVKIFFNKTHYFWIVSRFILIVLFSFATFNKVDFQSLSSLFAFVIMCLQLFSMTYVAISEIFKRKPFIGLKMYSGISAIFFGLLIVVLIFVSQNDDYSVKVIGLLFFPLWIILYGLWETISTKEIVNIK